MSKEEYPSPQEHIEVLKEFARKIIKYHCWNASDCDGADIQGLAIKFGLIETRIATEEDVDDEFDDYEVGDEIYVFSDILREVE